MWVRVDPKNVPATGGLFNCRVDLVAPGGKVLESRYLTCDGQGVALAAEAVPDAEYRARNGIEVEVYYEGLPPQRKLPARRFRGVRIAQFR